MEPRHARLTPRQVEERAEFIAARDAALAAGDTAPLREWVRAVEEREEVSRRLYEERARRMRRPLGDNPGSSPRQGLGPSAPRTVNP